jgi:hypothetical protein
LLSKANCGFGLGNSTAPALKVKEAASRGWVSKSRSRAFRAYDAVVLTKIILFYKVHQR